MKTLKALVVGLLICSPAFAAIAHVQTVNSTMKQGTSSSTITETYSSNVTSGNLLIAYVFTFTSPATATISSVADGLGNTFTLAKVEDGVADRRFAIYYCANAKGGASTVTATFSGTATTNQIAISEYSGVDTLSPLGVTGESNATSTTPSLTLNPNEKGSLRVALVHPFGATTITAGQTVRSERETSVEMGMQDTITTGSLAMTWTLGTSQFWATIGATFKPATRRATVVS